MDHHIVCVLQCVRSLPEAHLRVRVAGSGGVGARSLVFGDIWSQAFPVKP